jgi:hypothetical protein
LRRDFEKSCEGENVDGGGTPSASLAPHPPSIAIRLRLRWSLLCGERRRMCGDAEGLVTPQSSDSVFVCTRRMPCSTSAAASSSAVSDLENGESAMLTVIDTLWLGENAGS